ncbi:MAG: hypothetical protein ISR91_03915 [Candidatus Delongbacteria bacterium]|nr:hypothetical protein [bacterium]MBL7033269.1 hypothetical protein [Candidatus Delongbacteria bacterium]
MKKEIPLLITFLLGTWMILEFFFHNIPHVDQITEILTNGGMVIAAFTYILGVMNILQVNANRIKHHQDRPYKWTLLVGFVLMILLGFTWGIDVDSPFQWMYNTFYVPLQATMFSLLAFYIASAAFRAFRARSVEATLLLVAAVLVMLGRVPIGEEWIWSRLPDISNWIMDYPNMAGKRAILIGAALGAISTGLRVIIGMERSYLGGE